VNGIRILSAAEIARTVARRDLDLAKVVEVHAAAIPQLDELKAVMTSSVDKALERATDGVPGVVQASRSGRHEEVIACTQR
jgi:hypothetical protein